MEMAYLQQPFEAFDGVDLLLPAPGRGLLVLQPLQENLLLFGFWRPRSGAASGGDVLRGRVLGEAALQDPRRTATQRPGLGDVLERGAVDHVALHFTSRSDKNLNLRTSGR